MSKKRKKRKGSPWPIAFLFRVFLLISAASLVLSYVSILINPVNSVIPLFFGLYFIPLVVINIVVLVFAVYRRRAIAWITFIVLTPSILFADLFVKWGKPEEGRQGNSLTICTYNVGLFAQEPGNSRFDQLSRVARYLGQEKPAVVCLQEFYVKDTSVIRDIFPQYPYRQEHLFRSGDGGRFGNITLSKYPIVSGDDITFKRSTNLCLCSDIDFYGKMIRIYNTHLESHSISFTGLIKKMSNSEKVSEEIMNVHEKLANTFKKRGRQVDTIARHLSGSDYPAIICGDFNDTPMSYTYHILMKDKKDSFRESGKGFSSSYSYMWPLLRIDYILYPENFWSMSHTTQKVSYSDHYPVFSEIIIP